jgi:hypothetical protein
VFGGETEIGGGLACVELERDTVLGSNALIEYVDDRWTQE